MRNLCFDQDGKRFNYRVCGVCIDSRGRLLLEHGERYDFHVVPGGRCEHGEPSRDTVAREFREEFGRPVQVGKLLWIVEGFFKHDEKDFHELGIYYEVAFLPGDPILGRIGHFQGVEGLPDHHYEWVEPERLGLIRVLPDFLVPRLGSLPATPEHIVRDERLAAVPAISASS